MHRTENIKKAVLSAREALARYPERSLVLFVLVVVIGSAAGYARYQYVQAEIAAQQDLRYRLQKGFDDWRGDFANRLTDARDGLQETAQGASNFFGGLVGIGGFVFTAIFDYIGNLHIMIPVTIIYLGVGFFGTLRMRAATLLGALLALWLATNMGILLGSVIGLFAVAGLLVLNKFDPRLLEAIQALPARVATIIRVALHRASQRDAPTDSDQN